MSIGIKYDTARAQSRIRQVIRRIQEVGGDPSKALIAWGGYMLAQTDRTFRGKGRDGVKWPDLAPSTIAARRKRGITHRRPLQQTGVTKASFQTQNVGKVTQKVFTRIRIARVHQSGATIHQRARTLRPSNKQALAFTIGGQKIVVRKVEMPARTIKIPARPMIFIAERDRKMGFNLLRAHYQNVLARSAKAGA